MVTRKIGEFKTRDYQFAESRECKLLEACTAAYDAGDVDAFVDALAEYDRISKLDPWRIAYVLLLPAVLLVRTDVTLLF